MPEKRHWRLNAETIPYLALPTAMQVHLANAAQLPSADKRFNFGFCQSRRRQCDWACLRRWRSAGWKISSARIFFHKEPIF